MNQIHMYFNNLFLCPIDSSVYEWFSWTFMLKFFFSLSLKIINFKSHCMNEQSSPNPFRQRLCFQLINFNTCQTMKKYFFLQERSKGIWRLSIISNILCIILVYMKRDMWMNVFLFLRAWVWRTIDLWTPFNYFQTRTSTLCRGEITEVCDSSEEKETISHSLTACKQTTYKCTRI